MDLFITLEDPDGLLKDTVMKEARRIRKAMIEQAEWELSAKTAAKYRNGLSQPTQTAEYEAVLHLSGFLPTAIEDGVGSFDMKPSWLASPKAKISKAGNIFMAIPMPNKDGSGIVFRTISSKSRPDSWIHPGIKAHHFFERVIERLYK